MAGVGWLPSAPRTAVLGMPSDALSARLPGVCITDAPGVCCCCCWERLAVCAALGPGLGAGPAHDWRVPEGWSDPVMYPGNRWANGGSAPQLHFKTGNGGKWRASAFGLAGSP